MSASGAHLPLWLALLGVGVLGFVWQLYRVWHLRGRPLTFPHAAFWVSTIAWTTLGLHAHAPEFDQRPLLLWRWILPGAGLLATALLRWIVGILPHMLAEAEPQLEPASSRAEPGVPEGPREEADLDLEDRQLLGRMRALLTMRVAELMVPVHEAPTVRADAEVEAIFAELVRTRARRVAVLDATSTRSVGVIDGVDLVAGSAATPGPEEPPGPRRARQLCRPIPTVPGWRSAHEALRVLRTRGAGLTAIVDARDRVQGFLAWRLLLQALLGRPPRGGRL